MALIYKDVHRINGLEIPYHIFKERRAHVRFSIATTKAVMRLPSFYGESRIRKEHQRFLDWINDQLEKNASIGERFRIKIYKSGQLIEVMDQVFRLGLEIKPELKNARAKLDQEKLSIELSLPDDSHQKLVSKLLSRVLSKYFIDMVKDELSEANAKSFKYKYQDVRLKYNKSNWGSCSSKKNINLSSRLLLVPRDVRKYVMIHELAHLKEMNHSQAFWNLVASAYPNYKEAEKWLNSKGRFMDF